MAAKPTDEPLQRATGAVVVFNAGQAPTLRAGRQGALDHLCFGSTCGGGSVGIGATVSFCVHSSRTSSSRHT